MLAQTLYPAAPSNLGNRIHFVGQVGSIAQRNGTMLTRAAIIPITKREDIEELDRVSLLAEAMVQNGILPSGAQGTIVYRYRDGVAFEVEFQSPVHALLTLRREEIARLHA